MAFTKPKIFTPEILNWYIGELSKTGFIGEGAWGWLQVGLPVPESAWLQMQTLGYNEYFGKVDTISPRIKGAPRTKTESELFAQASDIEKIVYAWLASHSVPFDFQSQLIGGFDRQIGDAIVDFVLKENNVVIRVQGEYWHTGAEVEAKDVIQKERLRDLGYSVVDVWGTDIQNQLEVVMTKAIQGEEIPR